MENEKPEMPKLFCREEGMKTLRISSTKKFNLSRKPTPGFLAQKPIEPLKPLESFGKFSLRKKISLKPQDNQNDLSGTLNNDDLERKRLSQMKELNDIKDPKGTGISFKPKFLTNLIDKKDKIMDSERVVPK